MTTRPQRPQRLVSCSRRFGWRTPPSPMRRRQAPRSAAEVFLQLAPFHALESAHTLAGAARRLQAWRAAGHSVCLRRRLAAAAAIGRLARGSGPRIFRALRQAAPRAACKHR